MGLLDKFKKKKPLPKFEHKTPLDIGLKPRRFEGPVRDHPPLHLPRTPVHSTNNNQLLIEKLDKMSHKLDLIDKRLEIIEKIAKESQE